MINPPAVRSNAPGFQAKYAALPDIKLPSIPFDSPSHGSAYSLYCCWQGTFAEYLTLPVDNLHVVPESISDQEACFVEPLAAACRIAEQQVGA